MQACSACTLPSSMAAGAFWPPSGPATWSSPAGFSNVTPSGPTAATSHSATGAVSDASQCPTGTEPAGICSRVRAAPYLTFQVLCSCPQQSSLCLDSPRMTGQAHGVAGTSIALFYFDCFATGDLEPSSGLRYKSFSRPGKLLN